MKKFVIFILGVITGIILTVFLLLLAGNNYGKDEKDPGITLFEQPGEVINANSFKVFQSLQNGTALARDNDNYTSDLIVLLWKTDDPYFDNKIIKRPSGKCFRQIGIYKYSTPSLGVRTVPIVSVCDK